MTVQIHELVIRATLAEAAKPKQSGVTEHDLNLLREDILRTCLRQISQILGNERHSR